MCDNLNGFHKKKNITKKRNDFTVKNFVNVFIRAVGEDLCVLP